MTRNDKIFGCIIIAIVAIFGILCVIALNHPSPSKYLP